MLEKVVSFARSRFVRYTQFLDGSDTSLMFTFLRIQASCERRTKCADSATYEVTDPENEPKP